MDDVTSFIDERQAVRANLINGDDITAALGRPKQSQTEGGTEQREKQPIPAFDAMQTCFELREDVCVHDPR